eukprot:TRINITY_DN73071_c0_g1_i1.p1 TRINITY_DN73071_c0_g1~~TRINITY_DN73071_c0_g1_i1.p1  ORF type:complete len:522 (-),score=100.90 TRINITY_DN73071_c0_g1_i1:229-1755(-)
MVPDGGANLKGGGKAAPGPGQFKGGYGQAPVQGLEQQAVPMERAGAIAPARAQLLQVLGDGADESVEEQLRDMLDTCYINDNPLLASKVMEMIGARTELDFTVKSDDEATLLHLAVMCEATAPADMAAVVEILLKLGAPPQMKDADGDTVLDAILALASEIHHEPDEQEAAEACKPTHMAAVLALIKYPTVVVEMDQAAAVVKWLANYACKEGRQDVLMALAKRVGDAAVAKLWASEDFLCYLEDCAYEGKRTLKLSKVQKYLERGATPMANRNGASALLLVVLNPYASYETYLEVMRVMISMTPRVVGERDGFKFTPMMWAQEYVSIAQQHQMRTPNPGVLLALLPLIVALGPDDVEAGAVCLKTGGPGTEKGYCTNTPQVAADAEPPGPLRFMEGDRVLCRVNNPGSFDWEEGTVVGLWYRERLWPEAFPGAPYEVRLDIGGNVVALADHDRIIRRESDKPKAPPRPAAKAAARFIIRQREDGTWERYDTQSGNARACSPPDSDSD